MTAAGVSHQASSSRRSRRSSHATSPAARSPWRSRRRACRGWRRRAATRARRIPTRRAPRARPRAARRSRPRRRRGSRCRRRPKRRLDDLRVVEPVAKNRDPALEQALLVLGRVVLEVLRQVAVGTRDLDRLHDLRAPRPFELGQLGDQPRVLPPVSALAHGYTAASPRALRLAAVCRRCAESSTFRRRTVCRGDLDALVLADQLERLVEGQRPAAGSAARARRRSTSACWSASSPSSRSRRGPRRANSPRRSSLRRRRRPGRRKAAAFLQVEQRERVVIPPRSATRLPVGRTRNSPCQGTYRSKTWWRMPVPRVSVRNSVRKPISPRAGTTYSSRTQPLPWLTSASVRPLPQREELGDHAEVLLGGVDRDPLDRLVHLPSIVRVTTFGLPTVSSNPSRRIARPGPRAGARRGLGPPTCRAVRSEHPERDVADELRVEPALDQPRGELLPVARRAATC